MRGSRASLRHIHGHVVFHLRLFRARGLGRSTFTTSTTRRSPERTTHHCLEAGMRHSNLKRRAILASAILGLSVTGARAASVFWDADADTTTATGGTGTWDTSS